MEKIYEIIKLKQVVEETSDKRFIVRCPDDVVELAYKYIGEDDKEVFFVAYLNTKNHIVAVYRCHVGTINASIVSPRDVFKPAFLNNSAVSIICFHQHPTGIPEPSREDIKMSQTLKKAGDILQIQLLDSIIIGEKENSRIKFTSLKEKGYL